MWIWYFYNVKLVYLNKYLKFLCFQVWQLAKSFPTGVSGVRLLNCLHSHVELQITFINSALSFQCWYLTKYFPTGDAKIFVSAVWILRCIQSGILFKLSPLASHFKNILILQILLARISSWSWARMLDYFLCSQLHESCERRVDGHCLVIYYYILISLTSKFDNTM